LSEDKIRHPSRRRFVRWLATLGAAGGVGVLLSEGAAKKPLIGIAQAASGDPIRIDEINNGAGTTELNSTLAASNSGAAFKVIAPAPNTAGVQGITTASSSNTYDVAGGAGRYTAGVEGYASAGSGPVQGVYGHADSPDGCGVWGVATATATSSDGCGVVGYSESPGGAGVFGRHWATAGWSTGVAGRSNSPDGNGVWGRAFATTGYANGVHGQSDTPDGAGVHGFGSPTSGYSTGVAGESPSPDGTGVWGHASATTGYGQGVGGVTDSPDGIGVWGGANALSGGSAGVWGRTMSPDGVGVGGIARANGAIGLWGQAGSGWPGAIPIVAFGTSGQTAPLQAWRRVDRGTLAVVDASGNLGVGTTAPARSVHLQGTTACFRMDRNANSSAFILVRTSNTDFSTVWKTFYVGVDASAADNGSFFIGDVHTKVSGGSDKRLIIDNSGNIVPPTTNTGSIGTSSLKWANIYCTNIYHSDLIFENGARVTEQDDGFAFVNPQGTKIAVLDRQGNFHIKGKIMEDL
jgi:hypothetical protein